MLKSQNNNENLADILSGFHYRLKGYYQSAKKLQNDVQEVGYNISLRNIRKWLKNQAIYQNIFAELHLTKYHDQTLFISAI